MTTKFSGSGFSSGGYVTLSSSGTEDTTARRQVATLGELTNKSLFAIACIALGLHDPVDRAEFKVYFNKIDTTWSDDYIYDYLIEAAYKIKFRDVGP